MSKEYEGDNAVFDKYKKSYNENDIKEDIEDEDNDDSFASPGSGGVPGDDMSLLDESFISHASNATTISENKENHKRRLSDYKKSPFKDKLNKRARIEIIQKDNEAEIDTLEENVLDGIFKVIQAKEKEYISKQKKKGVKKEPNKDLRNPEFRDLLSELYKNEEIKEILSEKNDDVIKEIDIIKAEYNNAENAAKALWDYVRNKYVIEEEEETEEQKKEILEYIFGMCPDLIDSYLFIEENIKPKKYNWILEWKEHKRIFINLVKKGTQDFRDLLNGIVDDTKDIFPTSNINTMTLDKYIHNDEGIKVGTIVYELLPSTRLDLLKLKDTLDDEEIDYTFDDFITEIKQRTGGVDGNTIINSSVEKKLKELIKAKDNDKFIQTITELIRQNEHKYIGAGINPLSVGYERQIRGVITYITSTYSPEIKFLTPYTDPDFAFLSDKIEYWIPKIHMLTQGKVLNEKNQILRVTKRSINTIYIKVEFVKISFPDGPKEEIYYIRKFSDFYDFLKAWQKTYVIKYRDCIRQVLKNYKDFKNSTLKHKVKPISLGILLHNMFRFKKKIIDIHNYFISESINNQADELIFDKLRVYYSDIIIEDIIETPEYDIYDKGDEKVKALFKEKYPDKFN
jgi:hypothetical protein